MNFGQILTAMVTPFDHNEEIDFPATRNLIDYLIANGTDGLVISGTTGESPTLTEEEKVKLFKFTVEVVNGRVPVIAGTGSYNTKASIDLTRQAADAGVDGIMLVVPYYSKPSQEGLYQHFQAIAAVTSLPIMLYNIPGRSVVNMSVETVVRLSDIPNIVAIKEASGNLDTMAEIIQNTPENFSLYSGDDGLTIPVLSIGGAGVISVASHVIGNEMQTMIEKFNSGNVREAAKDHRSLLPIMKALFAAPNPTPVKSALNLKGIPVGGVRLPMIPLNKEELNSLQEVLSTLQQTVKI
ncbi:4-hydroxy-tetrahydrodipicolinate synthase [Psychrobacillus psychrodurans]|jgi:4-hydroxy-tetrahydrodipicolinate synthase|uniref:4-hydroxy-tetrahydrodipicolinate synthase n=1 Tax=Psychrobacillus psychrodurans TaxID=126157 RepID=UPI0008DFC9C1|nr:4-hydroxy-tetrahydrodipicolinate synthase [Psychrobacillus psychrodurans]MCK1997531.1 4-hydroxy-tetrahydrodipicolinate synthase [Psychrobacillus psychrodurans]MCZ8540491.1 4-hydroxy-tetrahydrodipicolinate synthase [Psychrobacillus psychrodurans]SFM69176.1 4-hydroxy-tetrahydrodipicolinate synthase [Psychrobacillus psychrodurans]